MHVLALGGRISIWLGICLFAIEGFVFVVSGRSVCFEPVAVPVLGKGKGKGSSADKNKTWTCWVVWEKGKGEEWYVE